MAGVSVVARYDRGRRGYRIEWTGGPDEKSMRGIAADAAGEFTDVDLSTLDWHQRLP